ncbi:MAG: histidine phosphatase family protein [Spirochaetales bacterium]|nr:histidine phosphatase family protein [Leptospiraceae bacterium]MCP5482888.1 histidine phosphatase family protein [Spirochaetales bacterium]
MILKNRYWALRHGISIANERGLIVSSPEEGVPGFGLSPAGRAELGQALRPERIRASGLEIKNAICYSSDFRRAIETARIFCELNGLQEPLTDFRLRERYFGKFDGQSHELYEIVWQRDREHPDRPHRTVESTAAVADRLHAFIQECEQKHEKADVVAVSHGDPLQILQAVLTGLAPDRHRTLPPLANGELRLLLA